MACKAQHTLLAVTVHLESTLQGWLDWEDQAWGGPSRRAIFTRRLCVYSSASDRHYQPQAPKWKGPERAFGPTPLMESWGNRPRKDIYLLDFTTNYW